MRRKVTSRIGMAVLLASGSVSAQTFSNPAAIDIPDGPGPATPFPSSLTVAGVDGQITGVAVTLTQFRHRNPDDVGVLLVGPSGQRIRLMSDVGAIDPDDLGELDPAPISTLRFTTTATASLPDQSLSAVIGIPSGNYLPTAGNSGSLDHSDAHPPVWPAPAPSGPYSETLTALLGEAASVNGSWQLFVDDDTAGAYGALLGGWSIEFTTVPSPLSPRFGIESETTLVAGVGASVVNVVEPGVAPASVGLSCAISPGTRNFRIVSGAQQSVAAPAALGPTSIVVAMACDRQETSAEALLDCTQSSDPARNLPQLQTRVICPALAPNPGIAPTVGIAPSTTLDSTGRGSVAVASTGAGAAPGEVTLQCSIAPGAAAFRITGGGTRRVLAPALPGSIDPPISLACDPQTVSISGTLSCQRSTVPQAALEPLTANIICPARPLTPPTPSSPTPQMIPASNPILLSLMGAVLSLLAWAVLRRRNTVRPS